MLRATVVTLLLCLLGTAWAEEESTFGELGGAGRGPRIVEQKAASTCKTEKNWPTCSDEDWGPKCPSGCRIQGLTKQADTDFANRITSINKHLKDYDGKFKSVDIRTKEVYNLIKGNLVAAQQTDGAYNQVSEILQRKIVFLKSKVSNQIERIKLLQRNIRDQVVEMKRLEVDIDIKLRSCKGSCASSVNYNVDNESYENIQKQLLQAESTNLRPNPDAVPMMKMRPIKDAPLVDSRYKALAQQQEQYPIFTDIPQYQIVLEGRKSQEVTNCPNGCRVQGLISKFEPEIVSRMEKAKQSWVTSNSQHITAYSEIKHLHDEAERDMHEDQEKLEQFCKVGNTLRRRLNPLKLKVKEQDIEINRLLSQIQNQLNDIKRLEVDTDIKIRSCKGSCREVHYLTLNLDEYKTWNKQLDIVKSNQLKEESKPYYAHLSSAPRNTSTSFSELFPLMRGKGLSLFENIDQYILQLEEEDTENECTLTESNYAPNVESSAGL